MKYCITIGSSPNETSSKKIIEWCRNTIKNNNSINQLFFFGDGTEHALKEYAQLEWSTFLTENNLAALICSNSAKKIGLCSNEHCNDGFQIGGLGALIEACLDADTTVSAEAILADHSIPTLLSAQPANLTVSLSQLGLSNSTSTGLDALAVALAFGLTPKLEIHLEHKHKQQLSNIAPKVLSLFEYGNFEICIISNTPAADLQDFTRKLKPVTEVKLHPAGQAINCRAPLALARTLNF